MNITFIGLGIMGSRMARNLLRKGQQVTVANRSKTAVEELVAFGARDGGTYADSVIGADIVFTMVSTPEVVSEIAFGSDGFIHKMKPGSMWVDCSTINPSFAKDAGMRANSAGIKYIDAPVTGTLPHAEKAQLTFYVGASDQDLEYIRPYFKMMGTSILHTGGMGQGAAYKMLLNGLLAQSMLMFSEAVLLGEKMGFDRSFLLDTLPGMKVCAPFIQMKVPMIASNDYPVMFPLEWMHKDLHLLGLTANELNQPMFLSNLTKEVFMEAKTSGRGREDFAAIFDFLQNRFNE